VGERQETGRVGAVKMEGGCWADGRWKVGRLATGNVAGMSLDHCKLELREA